MSQQQIIRSAKLHPGQTRIKNEIVNSQSFFSTIVCPRQWGKSVLLYNMMLYYAINNPHWYCVWATLTHQHAGDALRKIYNAVVGTGIVKDYNKTERRIELTNGSVLYFTGIEKFENYRSRSAHVLIIDEAAFATEGAFNVLIPSLATTGKKCILVSTPRGKHGEFYRYNQLGLTDNKMYSSHRGFLEENPFRNIELIESEKETKPEYVYRQEYLGEFLGNEYNIFKNLDEICVGGFSDQFPGGEYYAGLDLGRVKDYTVLTIMNKNKEVVHIYRDRQKSWDTIIEQVVNKCKLYNCKMMVEMNSIGDVIYEMIKKKYTRVYPFITTEDSKTKIIEKLIVLTENKDILLPSPRIFTAVKQELEQFTFVYSPKTRKIKYTAPDGLHDDTVMSLAIANECVDVCSHMGSYSVA